MFDRILHLGEHVADSVARWIVDDPVLAGIALFVALFVVLHRAIRASFAAHGGNHREW